MKNIRYYQTWAHITTKAILDFYELPEIEVNANQSARRTTSRVSTGLKLTFLYGIFYTGATKMYNLERAKNLVEYKITRKGFKIEYRKSALTGVVYPKQKLCIIPHIKSRKSLYIAIHELYHCLRQKKTKVYIDECNAEVFAHKYLRHLGFAVPRDETQRAKRYIRYKLVKALNRGLKYNTIPNKIINYIKG